MLRKMLNAAIFVVMRGNAKLMIIFFLPYLRLKICSNPIAEKGFAPKTPQGPVLLSININLFVNYECKCNRDCVKNKWHWLQTVTSLRGTGSASPWSINLLKFNIFIPKKPLILGCSAKNWFRTIKTIKREIYASNECIQ